MSNVNSVTSLAEEVVSKSWKSANINEEMWEEIEMAFLPVDELYVDIRYQREKLDLKVLKQLYEEFTVKKFGPILVSVREGLYYVIDGQHRAIALSALGSEYILCAVINAGGRKEEADIFSSQVNRARLKPFDFYRAMVEAHDPLHVEIHKWLQANNFQIKGTSHPRAIRFVTSFIKRWERDTEACKESILLCASIEPDEPLHNYVHGGFCYLLRHGVDLTPHYKKLAMGGYAAIQREANSKMVVDERAFRGGKNDLLWASAVLEYLNKRKRVHKISMPTP